MADELSPAYLREGIEFSVKLRGYDLEQVDEFLDRMADTIEALQQQVRQTTERAVRAEQTAAENAEADHALRRTLLVAQRTADDVIAEAEAAGERRREEAEETARSIIVAAEAEAARSASEAQRTLRDDIATLEAAREALRADVDALTEHLSAERDRLRRLADADLVAAAPPPATDVVVPPAPVVPEPDEIPAAPVPEPPPTEPDPETQPEPVGEAAVIELDDSTDDDRGDRDDRDDGDDGFDVHVPDDASSLDSDPFLDELRKATDDESPLGPRDETELFAGFGPVDGEHDLGLDRSRWGRRRRR